VDWRLRRRYVRTLNADGLGDTIQIDCPEELSVAFSSTLLDVHGEVMTLFT